MRWAAYILIGTIFAISASAAVLHMPNDTWWSYQKQLKQVPLAITNQHAETWTYYLAFSINETNKERLDDYWVYAPTKLVVEASSTKNFTIAFNFDEYWLVDVYDLHLQVMDKDGLVEEYHIPYTLYSHLDRAIAETEDPPDNGVYRIALFMSLSIVLAVIVAVFYFFLSKSTRE